MIPDMIHTPYIAPRISVMAPPPVTAERFVDELLSGLCMPDGGFVAHLAPSGDPFSNGWNAAMKLQLLLALVLIYTVGSGGDDDNHWNRGGGCFA